MKKHLIFYDGDCPLCNTTVRFLLIQDKKKRFLFAPLQGETAKLELSDSPHLRKDLATMVLLENYKTEKQERLIRAKAALRILWYLNWKYKILGLFSFFPSFIFDPFYRLIAAYRYQLFGSLKRLPKEKFDDRFLD